MSLESGNPVAFAAEISERRDRCSIVASGRQWGAERYVVDLVFYDHPQKAVERLSGLYLKHEPVSVVVDPRSQAATLLRPLSDAGVWVQEPETSDVVIAHGEFLDLVRNRQLAHLNQPPLTTAVKASQQRPLTGAQAWERRLEVDQSPLMAATLACWAFRRWEEQSRPGAWAV